MLWCAENDKQKAMANLLLAEKLARIYDGANKDGKQKYKSIFLNRCAFDPKSIGKNYEGTATSLLYSRTNDKDFDTLRSLPEFIELQKRLKQ